MSNEEYIKWKGNNPNEWNEIHQEVLKDFIRETYMSGKRNEDALFKSPSADKNNRVYTVERIENALINENDCCDNMIRMRKQQIDYEKRGKVSRII